MPTYSYACTQCDNTFDIVQSFTDDSLTECPVCGGRLRKLFNSVGIVFKGSGFYRTDSRAGSTASESASSDSSSSDSSKSDSSKSDSSKSDSTTSGSSSTKESKKDSSSSGSGKGGSGSTSSAAAS